MPNFIKEILNYIICLFLINRKCQNTKESRCFHFSLLGRKHSISPALHGAVRHALGCGAAGFPLLSALQTLSFHTESHFQHARRDPPRSFASEGEELPEPDCLT